MQSAETYIQRLCNGLNRSLRTEHVRELSKSKTTWYSPTAHADPHQMIELVALELKVVAVELTVVARELKVAALDVSFHVQRCWDERQQGTMSYLRTS